VQDGPQTQKKNYYQTYKIIVKILTDF